MDGCLRIVVNGKVLGGSQILKYLRQLVRCVVVKVDGLRETTLEAGVRVNKIVHIVGITRHNTDEFTTVVLQAFQQCVDGLSAKSITIVRAQSICLVNEQHSTKSRVNELVGLDGRLTTIACHKFSTVGLDELTTTQDAQRLEDIGHDTGNSRLTCTRITCEDIMLTLERVALATTNLKVEEGCKIRDLLLHRCQANQTVKFLQTVIVVHGLRLLIRNVSLGNGHQLLIGHRRDIAILQTLCLLLTNLVEQRTHGTTIGKVLVTRLVHLLDALAGQSLCLRREDIFLLTRKDLHDVIQLIGRIVFEIQEIVETALKTRIHTEQIIHLRAVTGGDDHKLTAVVLHTLHQFLQCLSALVIAVTGLTHRSQRVSLIDEEDATHSLVAETVNDLRRLALIGTDHLGTIDLYHMAAIQISDSSQNFAKLTGNSGLTCTRITCQDNMHRHLLLLTKTAFGTLYTILNSIGYLADGLLNLVHANERVHIAKDIIKRTLLGHITLNVFLLHTGSISTTTNESRKDVLGSLHRQMGIAKGFVLDFYLVLEEALQLLVGLRCKLRDTILHTKVEFGNITQLLITRRRQAESILETVLHRWVTLQEIVQTLGKTCHDDNGVIVPFIHLDKQLVKGIHLIGILIGQ